MSTNSTPVKHVLKVAHRGGMAHFLENSFAAFQNAIRVGVDMIEIDVWRCKSGEPVVFHDRYLDRLTGVEGDIEELSLDDLKDIRLNNGEQIPTLAEAAKFIDGRCVLNIELKGPNTAKPTMQLLQRLLDSGESQAKDFVVTSYNQYELRGFKKEMPQIEVGPILSGIPIGYAEAAQKVGAGSIILCKDMVNREFVGDAHSRGLKVFVYTVNTQENINRIKNLGVDGIISDFLDLQF